MPSQRPSTPSQIAVQIPPTPMARPSIQGATSFFNSQPQMVMSVEQVMNNPEVDYTRPELITLVLSDAGILTPEGVSQYLVGIYAD